MPLSDYKLLTVCIQVICLSMSISNFRRTSNAVCCKVILFPATGLPLSMKRYGGRLAHLRRSVTASLRRWVAIRLPLSASGAASCGPHHTIRNGFTTSVIHLLAADASIARCNYFYFSMRRLASWLHFTIMTSMANQN